MSASANGPRVIKVDGVTRAEDARALQQAGATVIGVDLVPHDTLGLSPTVSLRSGLAIREALTQAKLCVTIDPYADSVETALALARRLSADWIQVPAYGTARAEWRDALTASGLTIVLADEEISYEDDPDWIETRLAETKDWRGALLQVTLLDDMTDPWAFLTGAATEDKDGLIQLEEIAGLTERYDMVLSMDVTPSEMLAFAAAFPAARGYAFRIGTVGPEAVLALLGELHGTGNTASQG